MKLAARRGKALSKLKTVLDLLIEGAPLPPELRDHQLRGDWRGSRDCHLESDLVLIYTLEGDHVRFERTGTHGDLFE